MLRKLFEYFSKDKPYIILLLATLVISIVGYFYVRKLPKPETFIELAKYFWESPSTYVSSILLFLLISLAYTFCAVRGAYTIYLSWQDLSKFSRILSILFIIILMGLAFYFAGYFLITIFVVIVLGIIMILVVKALNDN